MRLQATRAGTRLVAIVATLLVGLLLCPLIVSSAFARDSKPITLRVGEEKVIWIGKIKDVSLGNPDVIDVSEHPDGTKIIVFGLKEGYS